MAKQIDQMDEIESRLDEQDKLLHEILLCLKGNVTMNIEGVLPAQKRIEQKLDKEIKSLNDWQVSIQKYFDVISSKGFRRFIFYFLLATILFFVYIKFGWVALVNFFKNFFIS